MLFVNLCGYEKKKTIRLVDKEMLALSKVHSAKTLNQGFRNKPFITTFFHIMALPVVKTLAQCADFGLTVLPYTSQLNSLPARLWEARSSIDHLKAVYLATNPLITAFAFSLLIFPFFLVLSEINKNYSQVDRAWSILPVVYVGHYVVYAHMVGSPTQKLDNLVAFSVVWGVS
jgi:hypothetical protein